MGIKSILGAFLFILLATFVASLIFVQTDYFGKIATRIITDISEKKFQTAVKVDHLSISFFPPGLELNQVNIQKKVSQFESFKAEFGKVGIYLSLIEIEEKKINLGEIRLSDNYIQYSFPKNNEEIKEIDKKIIEKIFNYSSFLPIKIDTLLIENTKVVLNHESLEAKRVKIFKKDKSFITRFHLANIKPSADSDFVLDEVWGDGEIFRSRIDLHRLKIHHDVQTVLIKGKIKDYRKIKGASADLNGELLVHLDNLKQEMRIPDGIKIEGGDSRASFNVSYTIDEISGSLDIMTQDLKSNIVHAQELDIGLEFEKNKLKIKKLTLRNQDQKLKLLFPVVVYDLKNRKILPSPIKVSVESFSLNNALRILGPDLEVLKGELTGDLSFEYKNNDLYFYPKDRFVIKNLGLVTGKDKKSFTVLMIKKAVLSNSLFSVIDNQFRMEASFGLKNSLLNVVGLVTKDEVNFSIPQAKVDLQDFGNIAKLDIKGHGLLNVNVSGPLSHTILNLKGETEGFEILGYRLDKSDKDITIDLADSTVQIDKFESKLGKTNISGIGTINYKTDDIALGITSPNANSEDLFQVLNPIFKDLDFLPADLDFNAKVDVDIFGKYNLDDLKIRSKVNFTDLVSYGENINNGSFDISLRQKNLEFNHFEAEKGFGRIYGDFKYGIKDNNFKLKYAWENLDLSSLNLIKKLGVNFRSLLSGKIEGGGNISNYSLQLDAAAFNTFSGNYRFDDSHASIQIRPQSVLGNANLLGSIVETGFNFALGKGMASEFKLKVKSDNIKPMLVAALGEHIEAENFTGKVFFEAQSSFHDGFKNLNLIGTVRELSFNHTDFNLSYTSSTPAFVVKDSLVTKWNLAINQPDIRVSTKGAGVFGKRVSLFHEIYFNSKIVEIFASPILSAEGFITNILQVDGTGTDFNVAFKSKSRQLDLSIDQLPVQINDLNYDISYDNNRFAINSFTAFLDSGSFSLLGDVFFDNQQPDVNLKFIFDKAEIPILGKSAINISGEGIVVGNNYPYSIGGEIKINKAQILNELNEFSSKSAGFSQVRFLPKNQESPIGKMFNLNIGLKAENPVRVTNSLFDIALIGEVRLLGNPLRPRGEGHLSTPVNSSRIFFKNNEYQIISADINFNPKKEISNPDFDIQAITIISNYKVYPKVYGDLERFNFDINSEPSLPRNSILSLIAFGYTEDIQGSLYAKDQRTLTQVGVGSFVFDRFKISDILNKQFGLQVNLGTVIEQSSTDSLLSGRSQYSSTAQGTGSLGRTRSATKIELKKRLDEALTLSVSSTMGGSIGQRQSMNLNYGITKSIQVEGVYELRTNEEGQADIIYNSIGGDLKFRRTFK
jgi:translocation and assembly module TamB